MTRGWGVVWIATLLGVGCGPPGAKPKVVAPMPPAVVTAAKAPEVKASDPHKVLLAVVPAESDKYPKLAEALNQRLTAVRVRGVDDYFVAKATLEVVQISIECIAETPECLTAAGKSISADRLLLARISKKKPLSVTVTLFDVDSGSEVHSATGQWKTQKLALDGIAALVDQAMGAELAPAGAAGSGAQTAQRGAH